jgi:hypothetical protein
MHRQSLPQMALILIAMAMSVSVSVHAQTLPVCNSTTHLDSNGNPCTNFTIAPGQPDVPSAGTAYSPLTEDGAPLQPDFPGSIGFLPGPNSISFGLPVDPLDLSDPYGYTQAVLWQEGDNTYVRNIVNAAPSNACKSSGHPQIPSYTVTYTIQNVLDTAYTGQQYLWNGVFIMSFVGTPHTRYGQCAYSYKTTTTSVGEMSATANPVTSAQKFGCCRQ